MTRLTAFIASILVLGLTAGTLSRAQAAVDPVHEDGAQLYRTWCASCHGRSGQGEGSLAPLMRRPVPDLTSLAERNGGVFPTARIRRIVDGRGVKSHGDPDMPVWGDTFRATPTGYSEAVARARIEAVVAYLGTIQRRNAH